MMGVCYVLCLMLSLWDMVLDTVTIESTTLHMLDYVIGRASEGLYLTASVISNIGFINCRAVNWNHQSTSAEWSITSQDSWQEICCINNGLILISRFTWQTRLVEHMMQRLKSGRLIFLHSNHHHCLLYQLEISVMTHSLVCTPINFLNLALWLSMVFCTLQHQLCVEAEKYQLFIYCEFRLSYLLILILEFQFTWTWMMIFLHSPCFTLVMITFLSRKVNWILQTA